MQQNGKEKKTPSVDADVIDIDALPEPSEVTVVPSSKSADENEVISVDSPVRPHKKPHTNTSSKTSAPLPLKRTNPNVIEITPTKPSAKRRKQIPEISIVEPANTVPHRPRRQPRPDLSEITPITAPPTSRPIGGPSSRPPSRSIPGSSSRPPGSSSRREAVNRGDLEEDELMNPSVSVIDLFRYYNKQHFWGSLHGVFVEFSTRMTSCAGTCTFKGRLGGCRIALSEPLLKFRPRSDLLSTLLHEMIHAYLFMTEGIQRDGFDGHGPKFLSHAARINAAERGRVRITPYHTFHDEVELYRVHHWTCQKCGKLIKRAMNRAPSRHDTWWAEHVARCGGAFVKTKEPPPKEKKPKRTRKVKSEPNGKSNRKIEDMFEKKEETKLVVKKEEDEPQVKLENSQPGEVVVYSKGKMVECPVCGKRFEERLMNEHLDRCLNTTPPAVETPLSGQLYKERHFGTEKSELETHHASSFARRETNIDLITYGLQRMFGGDDALLDFVIHGKAMPGNRTYSSDIIYELATAGDAPRIKPFLVEPTPAECQDDAKRRLNIADDTVMKRKSLPMTPVRSSDRMQTTTSFMRKEDEHINYTANRSSLERGTPKRKTPDPSSDTQVITIVDSPEKSTRAAQPQVSNRTPWWKTKPPDNSATAAKPKAKRARKEPIPPRPAPIHRSIAPPSTQPCPMCGISVIRSKLSAHVNACLDASGVGEEFAQSAAQPANPARPPFPRNTTVRPHVPHPPSHSNNFGQGQSAVHPQPPPQRRVTVHAAPRPNQSMTGQNARPRSAAPQPSLVPCPICNTPTPRSQLDRHTSVCLATSGLDFS